MIDYSEFTDVQLKSSIAIGGVVGIATQVAVVSAIAPATVAGVAGTLVVAGVAGTVAATAAVLGSHAAMTSYNRGKAARQASHEAAVVDAFVSCNKL